MSIEETNRMRISLGLKPLSTESKATAQKRKEYKAAEDREAAKKAKLDADEAAERVRSAHERRKQREFLTGTRTLGEAEDADGDLMSWVEKSRKLQEAEAARAARAAAEADEQGRRSDDDADDAEGLHAAALAGAKVRHDYSELAEGETVILTLADKRILDERGNLADDGDELENVLLAEDKKRKKARDASVKKAVPLFGEDGKRRALLDKYDEEDEAMMVLDDVGGLEAQRIANQARIKAQLAAGNAILDSAATSTAPKPAADYYTEQEAAAFTKPKKKKRKIRTKAAAGGAGDEDDAGPVLAYDAMEAEAKAAAGGSDLGSRRDRGQLRTQQAAERLAQQEERTARFHKALEKANWASLALKNEGGADNGEEEAAVDDDADNQLYESLARARRLAAHEASGAEVKSEAGRPAASPSAATAATASKAPQERALEQMARQVAAKREADEAELKAKLKAGLAFTETSEFVRNIQVKHEAPASHGAAHKAEEDVYMDVDEGTAAERAEEQPAAEPDQPSPAVKAGKFGSWVSAEEADMTREQGLDAERKKSEAAATARNDATAPELQDVGITGERLVGRGLASCLSFLQEKGALKEKVEWAGRTNDKKKHKLIGLDDVYTGGSADERLARDIENALTQRDEFGRIMTPKDRFRAQCYRFHGKGPSKNKIEQKQRKYQQEVAIKKAATSADPSAELDRVRLLQQQVGAPYVVLSGKATPLPPRAPKASSAGRDHHHHVDEDHPPSSTVAKTPMLGGGYTPLAGDRKVEKMLGLRKDGGSGSGDMPPPSSKPPRR